LPAPASCWSTPLTGAGGAEPGSAGPSRGRGRPFKRSTASRGSASLPPAWDRLRDARRDFRAPPGHQRYMGSRHPDCCASPDSARWASGAVALPHRRHRRQPALPVTFAKLHSAELIADGQISAGELASLAAELETHLADAVTITLYCLLCQAWTGKSSPG